MARSEAAREAQGEEPARAAADAPLRSAAKGEASPREPAGKGEAAPADEAPRRAVATTEAPWRSYKEILARLAQRVLDAQRPIRILQAIRWQEGIQEQFLKQRGREPPLPVYDPDLGFDPEAKRQELREILADLDRELGARDELGRILRETAEQYVLVVDLLEARGEKRFYELSRSLYGSAKDLLPDGKTKLREMGFALYAALGSIEGERLGTIQARDIDAESAASLLNDRFSRFFGEASVRVQVDDELLADAAAGSDYVKIRKAAKFTKRDLDILEAHEGWVHLATSLNGQAQPVARWLAKGPPRTTAVQEGLAALVEIFTLRCTPRRAKKLNDRVLAVDKAEDGATFLDVFEWYRTEGYEEDECFQATMRIFRGGRTDGTAPFTKDACYSRGIVLNHAFMLAAIEHDRPELIPFLFAGKVAHEDVPILHAHVTSGLVKPPPYLPPIFDDMNGLAIWLCFSTFFSTLSNSRIVEHYAASMKR